MQIKTIVEFDLVGYSDLVAMLEENLGTDVILVLNAQIREFATKALAAMNGSAIFVSEAGDGFVLAFDSPSDACVFAINLHFATQDHNRSRKRVGHRWFRTGITTGPLAHKGKGKKFAGMVIGKAVRLEAAVQPGQILADTESVSGFEPALQKLYSSSEEVEGKRQERFDACRCTVVPHSDSSPDKEVMPRVFIGYSISSEVQAIALGEQMKPYAIVEFWEKSKLPASDGQLDNFWAVLNTVDFAILLLDAEDLRTLAKQRSGTFRDDFFMRIGLLSGHLGRERLFILVPKEEDHPSMFSGGPWNTLYYETTGHPVSTGSIPPASLIRLALNRHGIAPKSPVSVSTDLFQVRPTFPKLVY